MLLGVDITKNRKDNEWTAEDSLIELEQLVETSGGTVVGRMIQKLPFYQKNTYLGKGKIQELINNKQHLGFNSLVVDDELTPIQQKTLEDSIGVKVIDRVSLILGIFAQHARTREGKLQVELAQNQYLLPRLAGAWSHLERLGGGIGTRGPGESQIETDRRLLQKRIITCREKLSDVSKQRDLYRDRRRREQIPIIALVGYTNSGKSSLLKALTKSDVLVEDKLFATLDPVTRRMRLDDGKSVLVTDTVGFIRKLPPTIVSAFHATLEELSEATILVHVIDVTSPKATEQFRMVENLLEDLKLSNKPRITVYNKVDLLPGISIEWKESEVLQYLVGLGEYPPADSVLTSTTCRWGLRELRKKISQILN